MGDLIVGLIIGAVVGALGAALILARRDRGGDAAIADERAARGAAEARAGELAGALERERTERAQAMAALTDQFKSVARETLDGVVQQYQAGQVEAIAQREEKLDERLRPLSEQLKQFREKVEQLETKREMGYVDVKTAAERLLQAQGEVKEEARKLNEVLGHASARGRWGEVQLERILQISGLREGIDYDTQVTVTDGGERSRPDVVVHLPNHVDIAVDAKLPYDAYDRATNATDDDTRDAAYKEFAGALKSHVADLRRKGYWSQLDKSPMFTVCFVPSDHLLSVAFSNAPELLSDSMDQHVLLAGPTTLLGLLWSAYIGWGQYRAAENMDEIVKLAEELVKRAATLFDHVNTLGNSLNKSVSTYNKVVGSLEQNLLVTINRMQSKGLSEHRELAELAGVTESPRALNPSRWPGHGDADGTDVIDAVVLSTPRPLSDESASPGDAAELLE